MKSKNDPLQYLKSQYDSLYTMAITEGNMPLANRIKAFIDAPGDKKLDKNDMLDLIKECKELVKRFPFVEAMYSFLEEKKYIDALKETINMGEPYALQNAQKIIEICLEEKATAEYAWIAHQITESVFKHRLLQNGYNEQEHHLERQILEKIATEHYVETGEVIRGWMILHGRMGKEFTLEQLEKIKESARKNKLQKDLEHAERLLFSKSYL